LQQDNVIQGTGYHNQFQVYSANLLAKLGNVDLTVISGYGLTKHEDTFDYSNIFGALTESLLGVGGVPDASPIQTDKLTEEVRLTGSVGSRMDWLVGLFYTNENSHYDHTFNAIDPATGSSVGGVFYSTRDHSTYEEYAGFSDLTFHVTDQFDIQMGAREGQNRQTDQAVLGGRLASLFYGGDPVIDPEEHSKDDSFTYLVTPRFKFSTDLMAYARLASGYRAGGSNGGTGAVLGIPTDYKPDTTRNYEIGVKGDTFDRLLTFDASLYYIRWNDIQIALAQAGIGYTGNASRAKSQGAELSLEAKPLAGMIIGAWVAFNDAVLTEPFPATSTAIGNTGDRLPYSSRFSSNLSIDQNVTLTGELIGFVGATVSYVGSKEGDFATSGERQSFSPYAKTDFRLGARYATWTYNFYVNNVADKRGALSGGLGSVNPAAFYIIQPRTVGLSVAKAF
jgi:iron complex outermembrane recepter protein